MLWGKSTNKDRSTQHLVLVKDIFQGGALASGKCLVTPIIAGIVT